MNKFKVGDRVRSTDGLLGTVASVTAGHIGVRHDYIDRRFHGLGGACEYGYGWWYTPTRLTKHGTFKGNIK